MDEQIKAILETIKTTAVAAGQTVGRAAEKTSERAGEIVEQTKHALRIIDLEKDIANDLKLIGQLVYDANEDPDTETDAIAELIAAVKARKGEIEELKQKIEDLKHSKKCPNPDCRNSCDKNDVYCPKCGTVLK